MKAIGVIVEYNPFHNGHQYHLEQAKKQGGADVVIAVMSGNYLQRGEPALVSKWNRTEMALQGGIDIVFELPYQYATQSADIFASGAVSLLDACGCHALCFGSESGDIEAFSETIQFINENHDAFQTAIRENTSTGVSYPKAVALSFQSLHGKENLLDLSKPNNILGLQYVAAINKQNSVMKPLTITRKNAEYHDEQFSSNHIASATSIRKALFSNNGDEQVVVSYLPQTTYDLLLHYKKRYGQYHSWENYWFLLKYKLLQSHPSQLRSIHEVEEGLEYRLLDAALIADSFKNFIGLVKTKRYTWTRLQRVCLHILNNVTKEEITNHEKPQYLRLLGMTPAGREFLRAHKKQLGLPLVSKVSSNKRELELDIRTSRIYSLALKDKHQQELMKQEFTQPPIQVG